MAATCSVMDLVSLPPSVAAQGEERFAPANEMVQWTISSDERRELGRAAGPTPRTLRCDTFPLQRLRREGEGSCRMLHVAPRYAALEPANPRRDRSEDVRKCQAS